MENNANDGILGAGAQGQNEDQNQGIGNDQNQNSNTSGADGQNQDPTQGADGQNQGTGNGQQGNDQNQNSTQSGENNDEFANYEGYLADMAKEFPDEDADSMEAFRKMAFDQKIPSGAFQEFYKSASEFMVQASQKAINDGVEALKAEFKNEYANVCKSVQEFTAKACADAGVDVSVLSHPAITANPDVIKLFYHLAQQGGESKAPSGTTGQTSLNARAELDAITTDTNHPDYEAYFNKNHPRYAEVNKKVNDLYKQLMK